MTIPAGTLVPRDAGLVLGLVDEILATGGKHGRAPEYWDGRTALRIADHLAGWLAERRSTNAVGVTA